MNNCLCIPGCSVNGVCPEHGDRALEPARAAYEAFCEAMPEVYRPPTLATWEELPDSLKKCWRAAAVAVRK